MVPLTASSEERRGCDPPRRTSVESLAMLERTALPLALIVGGGLTFVLATSPPQVQAPPVFAVQCAGCHGEEGLGTAKGPALAMNRRVGEQSAGQLGASLQRGNVAAGMPSFADLAAGDRAALVNYLLRLNVETITKPAPVAAATRPTTWPAPQPGDWRTYNGSDSGNRYSPLEQITTANVSALKLKWVFPIQYFGLETTPLAADVGLYCTGPNQGFASDAQIAGQLGQDPRSPPT